MSDNQTLDWSRSEIEKMRTTYGDEGIVQLVAALAAEGKVDATFERRHRQALYAAYTLLESLAKTVTERGLYDTGDVIAETARQLRTLAHEAELGKQMQVSLFISKETES